MLSLGASLLLSALADVKFSRTVDSLALGSVVVTIDGDACASSDPYGSNDCTLKWGSSYTGHATANMTQDVVSGSQLIVDMKVDRVIPFKFTCLACGANCTITVPVVEKTITVAMPGCPLTAVQLDQGFNVRWLRHFSTRCTPPAQSAPGVTLIPSSFCMSTVYASCRLAHPYQDVGQRHSGARRPDRCDSRAPHA